MRFQTAFCFSFCCFKQWFALQCALHSYGSSHSAQCRNRCQHNRLVRPWQRYLLCFIGRQARCKRCPYPCGRYAQRFLFARFSVEYLKSWKLFSPRRWALPLPKSAIKRNCWRSFWQHVLPTKTRLLPVSLLQPC